MSPAVRGGWVVVALGLTSGVTGCSRWWSYDESARMETADPRVAEWTEPLPEAVALGASAPPLAPPFRTFYAPGAAPGYAPRRPRAPRRPPIYLVAPPSLVSSDERPSGLIDR